MKQCIYCLLNLKRGTLLRCIATLFDYKFNKLFTTRHLQYQHFEECKCCVAYLSFSVHTNYTLCRLMWCCYKDSITTDSVHVNARPTFHVIQMNVSIFGNKEDYAMFLTDLKSHTHFLKDKQWFTWARKHSVKPVLHWQNTVGVTNLLLLVTL